MTKYPIPNDVAGLPVIIAEPWVQIGRGETFPTIEGAAFDRDGCLLVCHRTKPWSDLVKIRPDGSYETLYHDPNAALIGAAVHKDGRIFVVDIDGGRLLELSPEGEVLRELFSIVGKKLKPNDLAFDSRGNLYVSDFTGDRNHPSGGIYRLEAENNYTSMQLIAGGLACPNGVAFSPDERILWTGETSRNCVTRIALDENGFLSRHFLAVFAAYTSTGYEVVDSNKVDADGNVYQAMMYGGRALILNESGIPIANILLSDRDKGTCMFSPNLAIKPGTKEGYLVTSGTKGAWIYKFEALAECVALYSHM